MVAIRPTDIASKRTKNRLKEHFGFFIIVKTEQSELFDGRLCHYVKNMDGWFGWLPADEVDILTS